MNPARSRGFTLLEMIVVLMIAGMALVLGFQSLGQWRRAEAAIAGIGDASRETLLAESWLRDSLRGLTPVEEPRFSGDSTGLTGMTLAPVLAGQGGLTPIRWRLEDSEGRAALWLTEHERELELPLPDGGPARFAFLDSGGELHDRWPPALGLHEQLPAAIALIIEPAGRSGRVWLAPVSGARNPFYQAYEHEAD